MESIWGNVNLLKVLQEGGVGVMPTDTLYGIVGQAHKESTVNRIYTLRKRNSEKPCIILIGDMSELEKFSVTLSEQQTKVLKKYWPGPVSVILDCIDGTLAYLHRRTNTLAFRVPTSQSLRDLLLKTGPLIAPSANLEALPPSESIEDAKKYFGEAVELYIDGGLLKGKASKVVKLHKDGTMSIIRE
jgi:L-threonylcarbamoyladenylate synthase